MVTFIKAKDAFLTAILFLFSNIAACTENSGSVQTVQNAQKFLSMTLNGLEIRTSTFDRRIDALNEAFREGGDVATSTTVIRAGSINSYSAIDDCTSKFSIDYSNFSVQIYARNRRDDQRAKMIFTKNSMEDLISGDVRYTSSYYEALKRDEDIDKAVLKWGEYNSIRADGENIVFKFPGHKHSSTISAKSKVMADRIVYAMEFLRINCDMTASTGF